MELKIKGKKITESDEVTSLGHGVTRVRRTVRQTPLAKITTELQDHLTKYRGYIFYDANECREYSKTRDLLLQEVKNLIKTTDSLSEHTKLSDLKAQIEKQKCKLYVYCNKEYQANDILSEGDKKIMRQLCWDYIGYHNVYLFGVTRNHPQGGYDCTDRMALAIYGERYSFPLGESDYLVTGKSLTEGVTWDDYKYVMEKIYRHIVKICENI